jgi:hypothetical protein
MFGRSGDKAVCPVGREAQEWIERRMQWLADQFGWQRLLAGPVVLPNHDFFPDHYSGSSPEEARSLFNRVCGYMDVDPEEVDLALYDEEVPVQAGEFTQGAAGYYTNEDGRPCVSIEARALDDPLGMVATMAHELGHVVLLGQGHISPEEEDHEPLTDLLTVFLGLGVVCANSVIREKSWTEGNMYGWNIQRQGYLGMPEFGYALACFAWARGDHKPGWNKELRPDVRAAFQQGLTFLKKNKSAAFRPPEKDPTDQRIAVASEGGKPQEKAVDQPSLVAGERAKEPIEKSTAITTRETRMTPPGPGGAPPEKKAVCSYCGAAIHPEVAQMNGAIEVPRMTARLVRPP